MTLRQPRVGAPAVEDVNGDNEEDDERNGMGVGSSTDVWAPCRLRGASLRKIEGNCHSVGGEDSGGGERDEDGIDSTRDDGEDGEAKEESEEAGDEDGSNSLNEDEVASR